MKKKSYSHLLRELSERHYMRRMTFEEYRAERKELLKKIDFAFNGFIADNADEPDTAISDAEKRSLGDTIIFPVQELLAAVKNKL